MHDSESDLQRIPQIRVPLPPPLPRAHLEGEAGRLPLPLRPSWVPPLSPLSFLPRLRQWLIPCCWREFIKSRHLPIAHRALPAAPGASVAARASQSLRRGPGPSEDRDPPHKGEEPANG